MNYTQTRSVSPQLNAAETQRPLAIKPLSPWRAILYFLIAGLGLRLSIFTGIPRLVDLGLTPFEAFVVAFTVPVAILFALAFASAKWEGVPVNAPALAQRFRLRRITGKHILWLGAGILLLLTGVFFVTPAGNWLLSTFPAIQPPAAFPPALNPMLQNQELPAVIADWLGPEAVGNWALVALVLIMFFFNTFGEELYWRGIIFPRQELVHGRWTWLVHGLMWNLFHLPIYPWYIVAGLPVTLTISWVAQKTGNTWMAIILHALGNIFMYSLIISVIARGV